jgi:hypothetical protein
MRRLLKTVASLKDRAVRLSPSLAIRTARADGAEYRRVLTVLLVACAILPLGWAVKLTITSETLFPDFFGLWSFGRYVLTHAPATIYDDRALKAFQTGLGMPPDSGFPFPYPPWILLILTPFGALPYAAARVVWLVLTFSAYAAALAAWRWQRPMTGLLLLAPSSAVCFLVGQNGFVTAALMLGGIRQLRTRPIVAGALLASVAYKPQFAVLVPFVLLFGRHWRAMVGAGLSVAALSLATTVAFGVDAWGAWVVCMRDHAATLTEGRDAHLDLMPTVTSAVLLLGWGVRVAHLAQTAGALLGLLAVWRVRAREDPEAQAVLPLATILATPYAFHYDTPMIAGALLAVIAARTAAADRFNRMEFPLLVACILAPTILTARLGAIAAAVPAIFALGLWIMCQRPDSRKSMLRGRPRS